MLLSPAFEHALRYASVIHAGQTRKGSNIPYVAHLLGVTAIALEYGANEIEAIGALLHDAAEDAGGRGRIEDIRFRFGAEVAAIVEGCTDTMETPKPAWMERKQAYVDHVAAASASVRLVSASDKLHNCRAIVRDLRTDGSKVWQRFAGGKDGTLWYYRALLKEFQKADDNELVQELGRAVEEMHVLANEVYTP